MIDWTEDEREMGRSFVEAWKETPNLRRIVALLALVALLVSVATSCKHAPTATGDCVPIATAGGDTAWVVEGSRPPRVCTP